MKPTTAQNILNEVIIYGGLLCTRGEAILHMESLNPPSKRCIDMFMFARDQRGDDPDEIQFLESMNGYHEFSNINKRG